jgi:hypothetical protein
MNPADKNYKNNKVSALGHILDENDAPVVLNGMPLLSGLQADKGGSPEQPYVKNDGTVGYLTKTGKRPGAARGARPNAFHIELAPVALPAIDAELPDAAKNALRMEALKPLVAPLLSLATIEYGGSKETTTTVDLTVEEVLEAAKKAGKKTDAEKMAFALNPSNRVRTVQVPAIPAQTMTLGELAAKQGGKAQLTPAQVSEAIVSLGSVFRDWIRLADTSADDGEE